MTSTATLIRAALREGELAAARREEQARRAPERRAAGRYTFAEACGAIRKAVGHAAASGIDTLLAQAITSVEVPAYAPGAVLAMKDNRHLAAVDNLELYDDDLNAWLAKAAPRLAFRFSQGDSPQAATSVLHATKSDLLKPLIADAMREVGNDSNKVFSKLKDWAQDEKSPFNGVADSGGLMWTDAKNNVQVLTKKALAQRLSRLRTSQ
jgi:hypothetical protein